MYHINLWASISSSVKCRDKANPSFTEVVYIRDNIYEGLAPDCDSELNTR